MTYVLRGRFKRTYMGQRSVSAQQTSGSSVSPIMHTACYSSPPPLAPHKFLSLLEDTLFDSDSTNKLLLLHSSNDNTHSHAEPDTRTKQTTKNKKRGVCVSVSA